LGNLVLFKRVVKSCLDGLWGSWAPSSTMLPFIATWVGVTMVSWSWV